MGIREGSQTRPPLLAAIDAAGDSARLPIDGDHVELTHLDRVYWPEAPEFGQRAITKCDFVRYLIAVAPRLLAHAADRPLTLFRWPEGVAGKRVLVKHWETRLPPFVERVDVFSESKGTTDEYALCNNLATLVWLGQMGTLEVHVWHSRVRGGPDAPRAGRDFASSTAAPARSVLELPDYILFDVDPFIYTGREARAKQPDFSVRAFDRARQVALWLKAALDRLSLASYVKTSGKTGLHVVVPIRRTLRYAAVREVARSIAAHVAREHPEEVTTNWAVERRTGKVFIDYAMNVRGKSMAAPYSPRGLAGAPVSTPLRWRDVERAQPLDFRVPTVLPMLRRRADPWADLPDAKQSVEQILGVG